MKVLGDLYNSLFHSPSETNVYVDHKIWNQIKANLPEDYKIPDLQMIEIMEKFTTNKSHQHGQ